MFARGILLGAAALICAAACAKDETAPGGPDADGTIDGGTSNNDGGADSSLPLSCPAPIAGPAPLAQVLDDGDPIDVYVPEGAAATAPEAGFPVLVVFQGANVDKAQYAPVAGALAMRGFIVAVPNHRRPVFEQDGLYAEQHIFQAVLDHLKAEDRRPESSLHGRVDTTAVGLIGHSFGGVAALGVVTATCGFPFCVEPAPRPSELKAAVLFGTHTRSPIDQSIMPTDNGPIPLLFLEGELDGRSIPEASKATYDGVLNAPKAYLSVAGMTHYGFCRDEDPAGALADPNTPTVAQASANGVVARWTAAFFRRALANDAGEFEALAGAPPCPDGTTLTWAP